MLLKLLVHHSRNHIIASLVNQSLLVRLYINHLDKSHGKAALQAPHVTYPKIQESRLQRVESTQFITQKNRGKTQNTHLRRGSLVCVHMAGGPTPPTASERAIGGGEVTTWPMWVCTGLSAGSLGKSMAKVPTGSGENDSDGASPTDEPPPGEAMEGIGRDLKAVTTCCKRTTALTSDWNITCQTFLHRKALQGL